jgi:hypothetical protein
MLEKLVSFGDSGGCAGYASWLGFWLAGVVSGLAGCFLRGRGQSFWTSLLPVPLTKYLLTWTLRAKGEAILW